MKKNLNFFCILNIILFNILHLNGMENNHSEYQNLIKELQIYTGFLASNRQGPDINNIDFTTLVTTVTPAQRFYAQKIAAIALKIDKMLEEKYPIRFINNPPIQLSKANNQSTNYPINQTPQAQQNEESPKITSPHLPPEKRHHRVSLLPLLEASSPQPTPIQPSKPSNRVSPTNTGLIKKAKYPIRLNLRDIKQEQDLLQKIVAAVSQRCPIPNCIAPKIINPKNSKNTYEHLLGMHIKFFKCINCNYIFNASSEIIAKRILKKMPCKGHNEGHVIEYRHDIMEQLKAIAPYFNVNIPQGNTSQDFNATMPHAGTGTAQEPQSYIDLLDINAFLNTSNPQEQPMHPTQSNQPEEDDDAVLNFDLDEFLNPKSSEKANEAEKRKEHPTRPKQPSLQKKRK